MALFLLSNIKFMKKIIIFIVIVLISCKDKNVKDSCNMKFTSKNEIINHRNITTHLSFNKDIITFSVFNNSQDTISFPSTYLIFSEKSNENFQNSDVVIKRFIPYIVTERVIDFFIIKDKHKIISIDSSKIRDKEQSIINLAPRNTYKSKYFINCNESSAGEYSIFFFESNRFSNSKLDKIKYPQGCILKIEK